MIKSIQFTSFNGELNIPPSKSEAQRALLCAALADGESTIQNVGISDDVKAMLENIRRLGVKCEVSENEINLSGNAIFRDGLELNSGESGLGFRLLSGICAVKAGKQTITGEGSLLNRQQHFYENNLNQFGAQVVSNDGFLPLLFQGQLKGVEIHVDGSESSQYISGLLMGLPLLDQSTTLCVKNSKSIPYIEMTLETLKQFGVKILHDKFKEYSIRGNQKYTSCNYIVESDWSSAGCWLVAAALGNKIEIKGLSLESKQADLKLLNALKAANCEVTSSENKIVVDGTKRHGFEFDATHCPDLFPALVALAAFCKGKSIIQGVSRLVNKESDRGAVLQKEFAKIGIKIDFNEDQMTIHGGTILYSAEVDSNHDHRIAMCLAIVGTKINGGLTIRNAEAVSKSYPEFWEHFDQLSVS